MCSLLSETLREKASWWNTRISLEKKTGGGLQNEAQDNKAKQGLGLHTATPHTSATPWNQSVHSPDWTSIPQPRCLALKPAGITADRRGKKDPGESRRGLPAASRPKEGECAPGRTERRGRSFNRTWTFFCPPVRSPLIHINKGLDHVTCRRPLPQRQSCTLHASCSTL